MTGSVRPVQSATVWFVSLITYKLVRHAIKAIMSCRDGASPARATIALTVLLIQGPALPACAASILSQVGANLAH